jgi:surfactin synthase thioesterase subunit
MEINLDGGEKDIIKAIGLSGNNIPGKQVLERASGMDEAEFVATLRGLLMMGYVLADKQSFHNFDDVEHAEFHVNSGYARDLKEAIDPRLRRERKEKRNRRLRRQ